MFNIYLSQVARVKLEETYRLMHLRCKSTIAEKIVANKWRFDT